VDANVTDHIPPLDNNNTEIRQQREMYELENRLYELEKDIRQFLSNEAQLKRNYNDLKEFQCVLEKVEAFFDVHLEDRAKTELGSDFNADGFNDVVSNFKFKKHFYPI
jgi:hypothetical protein